MRGDDYGWTVGRNQNVLANYYNLVFILNKIIPFQQENVKIRDVNSLDVWFSISLTFIEYKSR